MKCIHHFASEFYSSKGLLYDASKEARKEKKTRKLEKQTQIQQTKLQGEETKGSNDEKESDEDDEHAEDSDQEEGFEDRRRDATANESNDVNKTGRTNKNTKKAKKRLRRDMYKIFDGSALMAIGKQALSSRIESLSLSTFWNNMNHLTFCLNIRNAVPRTGSFSNDS